MPLKSFWLRGMQDGIKFRILFPAHLLKLSIDSNLSGKSFFFCFACSVTVPQLIPGPYPAHTDMFTEGLALQNRAWC